MCMDMRSRHVMHRFARWRAWTTREGQALHSFPTHDEEETMNEGISGSLPKPG